MVMSNAQIIVFSRLLKMTHQRTQKKIIKYDLAIYYPRPKIKKTIIFVGLCVEDEKLANLSTGLDL